jgi:hypothetical protein
MPNTKYRISLCIACMNRLHHLQQTLLQNISDNMDYDNVEFVLLDYNSGDGMADWVRQKLSRYIEAGILNYYKTDEPDFFHHCHAKNILFKLAQGNIVCNINADHYTGTGFASYVNAAFSENDHIVLTPIPLQYYRLKAGMPPGDVWGKVCVKRDDFLRVGGFDERMIKFGNDDIDLINRLEMAGLKRMLLTKKEHWQFIDHSKEERFSSRKIINNIASLYISHSTPAASELIFLYNDGQFEKGTLIDNTSAGADNCDYSHKERNFMYPYSFPGIQYRGAWNEQINKGRISFLQKEGGEFILTAKLNNRYDVMNDAHTGREFRVVSDTAVIEKISLINYNYFNIEIMKQNLAEKKAVVNQPGFGKANLTWNFNEHISIK